MNSTDEISVNAYEYGGVISFPISDRITMLLYDRYAGGDSGARFAPIVWDGSLNSPSTTVLVNRTPIMSSAAAKKQLLTDAFNFEPATENERLVFTKKISDHSWLTRVIAFEMSGSGVADLDILGVVHEFISSAVTTSASTRTPGTQYNTYPSYCRATKDKIRLGRVGGYGFGSDKRLSSKTSQFITQLSSDEVVFFYEQLEDGNSADYAQYKVVTFRGGTTHVSGDNKFDKKHGGAKHLGFSPMAATSLGENKIAMIGRNRYTPAEGTSTAEEIATAVGHKHPIVGVATEDAAAGANCKIATSSVVTVPGANFTIGNNYYSDDGTIRKGDASGDLLGMGGTHLIGTAIATDQLRLISNDWDLIL